MLRAVQSAEDDYLAKLVKYVPVEGLAPAVLLAAGVHGNDTLVWVALATALLVGAVLMGARVKSQGTKPRLWFWPFMAIAFAVWVVGASTAFRDVLGVDAQVADFSLGLAAFALPLLDSGLATLFPGGD